MIWLLIFIILVGYIVAERDKIILFFKMTWEKLKELKIFRGTGKKLYRNINDSFKEWVNGEFEVKGIDRKKLNVDQLKEIKNWSPEYSTPRSVAKEKHMKF